MAAAHDYWRCGANLMEEEVSANENKKRSQDDIYWKANNPLLIKTQSKWYSRK